MLRELGVQNEVKCLTHCLKILIEQIKQVNVRTFKSHLRKEDFWIWSMGATPISLASAFGPIYAEKYAYGILLGILGSIRPSNQPILIMAGFCIFHCLDTINGGRRGTGSKETKIRGANRYVINEHFHI